MEPTVLVVGAHPDDIEFYFAGTLLLLKERGWNVHMWNLANGSGGSKSLSADAIAEKRWEEALASAQILGATMHAPLFSDLNIFYDADSLARVSSVVRSVNPSIILTHPPLDYMEDHENTCRLLVTAAMAKGIPNHPVIPPCEANDDPVALYHAPPMGCRTGMNVEIFPTLFVNIESVLNKKIQMLMAHESQMAWLQKTQEMASLEEALLQEARDLGKMSGKFIYAEAFTPHHKRGYCQADFTPLEDALRDSHEILP